MSIVRRYLDAVAHHDWDTARSYLSSDVVRVGPFGDTYRGRDEYLQALRPIMEGLEGYRMEIASIAASDDGSTVTAELSETVVMDERTIVTPECLVFDLDSAGLIAGIRIYIQQIEPPRTGSV